MFSRTFTSRVYLLVLVLFGGIALGGVVHRTAAQAPTLPTTPAEAETGLAIFGERCATCHGPLGLGDGEMAAQLPAPPRALADPTFIRAAVPTSLFDTITNGRVQQGMPPFGPTSSNAISEADRWNLVAAVYSLATPADNVAQGQTLYETKCANCHGPQGKGDGPQASQPPGDLTNLAYWSNTSNQAVFDVLVGSQRTAGHDLGLTEGEAWSVVDYLRTFSYAYSDPQLAFAPLEAATVSGQVTNGTTGATPPAGLPVTLRAFSDFEVTLTLTATTTLDGRYHFDLAGVSPQWVYITTVHYDELNFTGAAGQLNRRQPDLDLPIIVYDPSSDPAAIQVDQVHVILQFTEDRLEVNELYLFRNSGNTVFVGATGNPQEGTVAFNLPPTAESPSFQRGLGSFEQFVPATEVIEIDSSWADTVPLQPGDNGLTLLVRYELPYEDSLTLAHLLPYPTAGANLILPEAGVRLVNDSQWTAEGQQTMAEGSFLTYSQVGLAAGSMLEISLEGRPRAVTTAEGNTALSRNQGQELAIGGAVLLVTVAAAVYVIRRWRQSANEQLAMNDEQWSADDDPNALLQAIADLDDAYEAGQIAEPDYGRQREQLKEALKAVWGKQDK
ncbi:MAG: c-type cytochrome [Chloroflexota bacterium]